MKNIEWIKSEATGGGVITYYGKFTNGNYFIQNSSDNILHIYDADVSFMFDGEHDTYEWEKEHTIKEEEN